MNTSANTALSISTRSYSPGDPLNATAPLISIRPVAFMPVVASFAFLTLPPFVGHCLRCKRVFLSSPKSLGEVTSTISPRPFFVEATSQVLVYEVVAKVAEADH